MGATYSAAWVFRNARSLYLSMLNDRGQDQCPPKCKRSQTKTVFLKYQGCLFRQYSATHAHISVLMEGWHYGIQQCRLVSGGCHAVREARVTPSTDLPGCTRNPAVHQSVSKSMWLAQRKRPLSGEAYIGKGGLLHI